MDQILSLLSETVPKARTLEELTRPLLMLLSKATVTESTYLTAIDIEQGIQRVEYDRNIRKYDYPRGARLFHGRARCASVRLKRTGFTQTTLRNAGGSRRPPP